MKTELEALFAECTTSKTPELVCTKFRQKWSVVLFNNNKKLLPLPDDFSSRMLCSLQRPHQNSAPNSNNNNNNTKRMKPHMVADHFTQFLFQRFLGRLHDQTKIDALTWFRVIAKHLQWVELSIRGGSKLVSQQFELILDQPDCIYPMAIGVNQEVYYSGIHLPVATSCDTNFLMSSYLVNCLHEAVSRTHKTLTPKIKLKIKQKLQLQKQSEGINPVDKTFHSTFRNKRKAEEDAFTEWSKDI